VNPRARSLTKDWLRYAIARWGHSPAVMAWELFNEVQWVDAAKKHPERIGDIVAWHREMGQFVRSLDPYHHLVTSSSSEELNPRVFETMDYLQPHSYPPSIFSAILSAPIPHDKPSFFGEFGVHFELVTEQVAIRALRDGFWAGLLACQAGPAQYWYWDEAYKYHLYQEYARESGVLKRTGFAENPKTKPVSIAVSGGSPSDLYVMPGIGWGATTKYVFELPVDGSTGSLPELSSYIQNRQGHNRGLMRDPIRLRFHAIEGGEAHVLVGGVSKAGGALQLSLNGAQVLAKSWPGSSGDRQIDQELVVPFPKGENELSIDNPGTDWIKLKGVRIPRIGSGVLATGMSSDRYCLMRIQWLGGFGPGEKSISFSSVIDGNYRMRQFDINTGIEKDSEVALRSGRISGYVPYSTDEGVALFHQ